MRSLAALLLCLVPLAAAAQETTLLEQYNDWEAHRVVENGQTMCYILSRPTKLLPTNRDHGDVHFFLMTQPSQNIVNQPSLIVGYPFAPGSTVTVQVDDQEFSMFTREDGAWMESAADEQQLVAAMRAGSAMTVKGRSSRGTDTTYTFSLSGVTAGSNRIQNGCN